MLPSKKSKKPIVPLPDVLPDDFLSKIIAIAFAINLPDSETRYRWTRKGLKLNFLCGVRLMCKAFAVGLEETMYKCAFLRYRLVYARVVRNEASWRLCCIRHRGAQEELECSSYWYSKKGDRAYMAEAQDELANCERNTHDDDQARTVAIRHLVVREKRKLHAHINSERTQRWIYRRSQWDELARIGRPLEPVYDTDDELWHSYYDMNA